VLIPNIPHMPHIRQKQFGNFTLTDAIRAGNRTPIVPVEGYRISRFRDAETLLRLPVLGAAVSADKLFDVFMDLLDPLGETVHVVLETSHETQSDTHEDLRRGDIDLPVLKSHFYDFEDLLLNDGCTGVAVVCRNRPIEVQMDEHKLLFVYAPDMKPFKKIMKRYGIDKNVDLRLIAEAEHFHQSQIRHYDEFQRFASQLGCIDYNSVATDEFDATGDFDSDLMEW
jgi:hypothetical protein